MAQEWSRRVYHSARWKHLADLAMKRTETTNGTVPPGMCERCYQHGLLHPAKLIHHITPITPYNVNDPSVTLNIDNLMRVCQDCHAALHSGNDEGPRRFTFDERGNIVWNEEQWLY